ncbi:hypothetical protein AVEN_64341-1 [Araneus ventricosus]|uniref:Uncharacterized protein n=1 Tax=Araneus ventricosus TaxID=182803 RepID=A0A4Y2DC45_ARAVE|nr:hypothetical protein AVEN_64341-1 [Araneus ventricosus]
MQYDCNHVCSKKPGLLFLAYFMEAMLFSNDMVSSHETDPQSELNFVDPDSGVFLYNVSCLLNHCTRLSFEDHPAPSSCFTLSNRIGGFLSAL